MYTVKCISLIIKTFLSATDKDGYRILQVVKKKDITYYEMFSPIDTPTITLPCQILGKPKE